MQKISCVFFLMALLSNAYGLNIDPNKIRELEIKKLSLRINVFNAVKTCKCFAQKLEEQVTSFPDKPNKISKNAYARSPSLKGKPIQINSKKDIYDFVSDIKISTNKNYPPILKIIDTWPIDKTLSEDLKQLDLKVSEALRALSSYCVQPYQILGDQLFALSRGKVDLKTETCLKSNF